MLLNDKIDQTLLRSDAQEGDIIKLINEGMKYNFASVCLNPMWVALASSKMADSEVKVCTVVGFPLGANTTGTKAFETEQAIINGADEIDMVMNIGKLKDGDYDYVLNDINMICDIAHKNNKILKVIIESSLLTNDQIVNACKLIMDTGADFVKTSTGFSMGGATVEVIELIKKTVGNNLKIKASGGIKSAEDAIDLIEAGADRLGTSSGVEIVEGNIILDDSY